MSRCLPFPPPNYVKNGLGGEALLQQLELRRVTYSQNKKEGKKHKRRSYNDKKIEGDKKSKRSHEKKRSHDERKSEKDDKKSKSSHEKKKERRRRKRKEKKRDVPLSAEDVEKMETNLEYTNLTMNRVPLPMEMVPTHLEDEDWLSRKKNSKGESESKTADQTEHLRSGSSTDNGSCQGIQPHARYLPHADVYALPYVLPY